METPVTLTPETISSLLGLFAAAQRNIKTDYPVALIPSGSGGTDLVSLEQHMAVPNDFKGTLQTHLIEAFATYVSKQPEEHVSPIFIDVEAMRARVWFDFGTHDEPQHRNHGASLTLKQTPELEAVLEATERSVSRRDFGQAELADFIEDWEDRLNILDAQGNAIEINHAVKSVRKIDITAKRDSSNEEDSFRQSRGVMESIELASSENFPAFIEMKAPPYHGLDDQTIRLRVGVRTDEHKPRITLRWMGKEADIEEFGLLFEKELSDHELLKGRTVLHGKFS